MNDNDLNKFSDLTDGDRFLMSVLMRFASAERLLLISATYDDMPVRVVAGNGPNNEIFPLAILLMPEDIDHLAFPFTSDDGISVSPAVESEGALDAVFEEIHRLSNMQVLGRLMLLHIKALVTSDYPSDVIEADMQEVLESVNNPNVSPEEDIRKVEAFIEKHRVFGMDDSED